MIDIVCIRGAGDKEAPEINDPLINSEYIAKVRGTNFINENWYKRSKRTLRVPYKDGIFINQKLNVYESLLDIVDVHIATDYSFTISNEGIWAEINVEQHEEGE